MTQVPEGFLWSLLQQTGVRWSTCRTVEGVDAAAVAMYLVCKYGPFKRSHSQQPPATSADRSQQPHQRQQQQQDKDTRKQTEAADKELQHLNHKIVSHSIIAALMNSVPLSLKKKLLMYSG